MTGKFVGGPPPLATDEYLFGRELPKGVKKVEFSQRPHDMAYAVTWVGTDGSKQEYVFDELGEQLEAVIVAMRLTC